MTNSSASVPEPRNEPVLDYAPDAPERRTLKAQLDRFADGSFEIPLIIGGRDVTTGDCGRCILPHDHARAVATYHKGDARTVEQAIAAAARARPAWAALPWEARAAVFLKAADLLAGRYRPIVNAATMLNQSKTVMQAEIDAACELIDFWRFNPAYMRQIFEQQPTSQPGTWNYVEYRPLEGFVFAVTPFNFTAIAGNLPTSPAMMGNTMVSAAPAAASPSTGRRYASSKGTSTTGASWIWASVRYSTYVGTGKATGRPAPVTDRNSIVSRSSLPLPTTTQSGSTPRTAAALARNSSASGRGYRRRSSGRTACKAASARAPGGYGFSLVLSLTTCWPASGCSPGW